MKHGTILFVALTISACQTDIPSGVESTEAQQEEAVRGAPDADVQAEWITLDDGQRVYLSRPVAEGTFPGVIMIHEWWGLNENIRNMARDLAAEEYVVLAVDLFDGKVTSSPEQADEYSTRARENMDEAITRMKSVVAFLRESNFVVQDALASIGWCFGGHMSLQLSLNENLAATVIYYGNLETDEARLSRLGGTVLGIFGDQDTVVPVDSVHQFEEALNRLGIENEIYIYEGVGHAFANPSNPEHDPEKTEDAWMKTVTFLNGSLKSPVGEGN